MKKIILIIALMLGAASVQAQDIFSLGQMLKNLMPDTTATEQGMLGSHYFIADYRGDVRCVIDDAGTLEESTSYYPYGMPHGTGLLSSVQPYKYTGKELDRETGLDWYDSQARMLMPDLGRTTTMDPLAEKYTPMSPYLWCGGNPVKFVDPTGLFFTPNDSINASVYIDKIKARIDEVNNSDATDKNEQLSELNKSLQDIEDMRNDLHIRYSFIERNTEPETKELQDGTILMVIDCGSKGNFAHEIRHGGQIARGEWGYDDSHIPNDKYGISHEVSAYKAEYSSCGFLLYDCMNALGLSIVTHVGNIQSINSMFVNRIYQNGKYLYGEMSHEWKNR